MMLYMSMMTIPMLMMLTPMKVSFFLVLLSISWSIMSYTMSHSVFMSSTLVISFSSGMMILFCFCSMMSMQEKKNNTKMVWSMPMVLVPMLVLTSQSTSKMKSSAMMEKSMMLSFSPTLVMMMTVVVMVMCCINLSMFHPSKKMMETY